MSSIPIIIGHRGAPALLPENTLESFRLALEEGRADAIEFDVHFSRDRVPVVIHDATLERTTQGRGFVAHQTWADLQRLDAGKGFRIPSLEEIIRLFKAKTLAVEIKDKSAELVHAVMALIQKHKAGHCVVGSKHHLVAETLRKHYPEQTRFLSQREIVQHFIASRVACHSRVRQKPDGSVLRRKSGNPFKMDPRLKSATKMADPSAMFGGHSGMTGLVASMPLEGCGMHFDDPKFLDWLHGKGMKIYFWTINDPQEIKRLAAAGADGIITDNPGAARQALGPRN